MDSLTPSADLTILIPARAGSKRCVGKNKRTLGGKPLIMWALEAAQAANVARIIVSTDDIDIIMGVAFHTNGVEIHERKPEHATDDAPDFAWVNDLKHEIKTPYFCILRPTSPFRTASTIRRAFAQLVGSKAHSVRAVQRVISPHPAKMWQLEAGTKFMKPLMYGFNENTPWHSSPTQSLPVVYKQTSSLEMAQTWVIEGTKTISGYSIAPFLVEEAEAISIDTEDDWDAAEAYLLMHGEQGYGHAI